MYKITANSEHGGIWNGNKAVRELETDNAEVAAAMKSRGYTVEEFSLELDKMTAAQLKKYAKDNGIDLGDATKRDPILEIIKAAEAE